jgi:2-keto-4-pentenoate hydratase/2-oxohepta-3-ene-1,7-dioic acid hydratase in catechol pathway
MTDFALASYKDDGVVRGAIVVDGTLYDLARALGGDASNWRLENVFRSWSEAEAAIAEVAQERRAPVENGMEKLTAPLRPARIFAAASNYVEHAEEMGTVLAAKANSRPYMFLKTSTTVIGPGESVLIPPESKKVDWEVELGVVIGARCRRVSEEDALDCVAGYTVVNDVSARDLVKREDYPFKFDWFQGKNFDTFCPLGPWIVPARFIPDPQAVHLRLAVNGETMQDASTAEMIFTVREQIAYLSSLLTLEPGDVIATGTPTGVGMSRGIFLKPGDVMLASIDAIGALENPVRAEDAR